MSGAKGKSGGARPGAGRPRKEASPLQVPETDDPLAFLIGVMKDMGQDPKLRVRAAIAATQYLHAKKEGGKKDEQAARSEQAAKGKFAASAPPKLSIVN